MNYDKLPESARCDLQLWVEHGIYPSGSFLGAILHNDLVHAFAYADGNNTCRMRDYADWLYNDVPIFCWGSDAKIKKWKGTKCYPYGAY